MADILANSARLAAARRKKAREQQEAKEAAAAKEVAAAKEANAAKAEPPVKAEAPQPQAPAVAATVVGSESAADSVPDAKILATLAAWRTDFWSASPAKLRSLLLEKGVAGVSEKRLRKLKQACAQGLATAAGAAEPLPAREGTPKSMVNDRTKCKTAIETRPGRGRCAIAASPLRAGTTLDAFCGPPFAACLLPSAHGQHCDGCFGELASEFGRPRDWFTCAGPLGGTATAAYCSHACRDADLAKHPFEAHWGRDADPPPPALRLAIRCLWRRHGLSEDSMSASDADGDVSCDVSAGDAAPPLPSEVRHFDEMRCEAPASDGSDEDNESGKLAVAQPAGLLPPGTTAADVARMLARLRANAFSFTDGGGGMTIGFGCYPTAAILNHSCALSCPLRLVPLPPCPHPSSSSLCARGSSLRS